MNSDIYEFGDFRLDLAEETIFSGGNEISLTPRAFAVLRFLMENAGRIVRKEEFFDTIWAGQFVEDNNLTVAVSQIRKALGGNNFIETVPRRGYRFNGEVRKSVSTKTETLLKPKNRVFGQSVFLALGVIILFFTAGFGIWHFNQADNIKAQRKLAVLPFVGLQPNAEIDYLGYALADSMIAKLAPVKILGVRSSQSISKYVNQTPTPTEVADELQADLLLTGTYQKVNENIQFRVQLVDIPSNEILYFDNFEVPYNQISQIQERLARRIISELGLSVSTFEKQLLRLSKPHNEEAYKLYLQGIDHYTAARFPKAIETLEQSIKLDPNFARAWDILGASYMVNASTRFGGKDHYESAEQAFKKSLELNPNELHPRILLSDILIETNRVEQAVEFLREMIKQNPDDALTHWELSYAYRYAGFLEEAKREGEYAHKIDPGFNLRTALPNYYLYLKEYEKYKTAIPARFDSAYFTFYRGFVNYHLGDFDAAKIDFDKAYDIDKNSLQSQIGKALSYKMAGNNSAALKMLNSAEKEILSQDGFDAEGLYKLAQAYAVSDKKESAITILRISIENGFFAYPYIAADPLLENLSENPEYESVLQIAEKRHNDFKIKFF